MGTSASSNGPGSGVSLDPPWLDDIDEMSVVSADKAILRRNSPDAKYVTF